MFILKQLLLEVSCWSWSLMSLGHKGLSPFPCAGQSPQSRGTGPYYQRLYNAYVNQRSCQSHIVHLHRWSDPIWRCIGGMHHCRTHYRWAWLLWRRRLRFTFYLKPTVWIVSLSDELMAPYQTHDPTTSNPKRSRPTIFYQWYQSHA
jgi:hypothetical protein